MFFLTHVSKQTVVSSYDDEEEEEDDDDEDGDILSCLQRSDQILTLLPLLW